MSIVGSAGSGLGGAGDIGGALGSFYGHEIEQSLRFEDGDSPYLSHTPASAGNRDVNTTSFWVKRANLGTVQMIFTAGSSFPSNHDNSTVIQFLADDTFRYRSEASGSAVAQLDTTRVFRDVGSWYHIVLTYESTNATSTDRIKLYVNGVRETVFDSTTYPTSGVDNFFASDEVHQIGRSTTNYIDCYLAEFNFIDGTALGPDSFGELKDGIWVAKNTSGLTFGTNGFHLDFADSSAIGNDVSGQNNDFAVSGLAATDVVLDSPTNNFATMNPLHKGNGTTGSITFSEGNLASSFAGNHTTMQHAATMALPTTGKWYWEQTFTGALTNGSRAAMCGIWNDDSQDLGSNNRLTVTSDAVTFYSDDNKIYSSADGSIGNTAYTGSIAEQTGAVVSFAVDMDNTWVWVAVNGTYINGTPDFSDGTNRVDVVTDTNGRYIPFWAGDGGQTITWRVNFGQDSANVSSANSDSKGIGTFEYAVPSGYTSLCTANLPEPEIIDGSEYFNTVLWSGNGASSRGITGVSHAPDFVWIKTRNQANEHSLFDSVRGVAKDLESNSNAIEQANNVYGYITSFDSDGFTVEPGTSGSALVNESGNTFVAWNWKAGTSVSGNTTGSGTAKTYTGSANTEAGFSIIKYVGNGTSGHTIPHNLGAVPKMIIAKNLDQADDWAVYHNGIGAGNYLKLNESDGSASAAQVWNDTTPSDSVFSVGSNHQTNATDEDYIAYCFADIDQYCKAGSYIGNSNADGTYVHLNFRPAWVMIKEAGASGFWMITDNKVYPNNDGNTRSLAANDTGSETTISNRGNEVDFLSNGFKIRASTGDMGASNTHIYLAFAEQPFKYANAR